MKTTLFTLSVIALALLAGACNTYRGTTYDDDDIYYSADEQPGDYYQDPGTANGSNTDVVATQPDQTETYADEDGNVTVNNYYNGDNNDFNYDDYYDYAYASRIRRFHRPVYDYGYYDSYYTNAYWYGYDPIYYGTSIYLSYPWWRPYPWHWYSGWNLGWSSYYGWYGGWGPHFGYGCGWYDPYAYYGWGYSPYNSYWNGYQNGYWNGYQNGLYASNGYYYYNSYDNNSDYYYGNRSDQASNTSGSYGSFGQMYEASENGVLNPYNGTSDIKPAVTQPTSAGSLPTHPSAVNNTSVPTKTETHNGTNPVEQYSSPVKPVSGLNQQGGNSAPVHVNTPATAGTNSGSSIQNGTVHSQPMPHNGSTESQPSHYGQNHGQQAPQHYGTDNGATHNGSSSSGGTRPSYTPQNNYTAPQQDHNSTAPQQSRPNQEYQYSTPRNNSSSGHSNTPKNYNYGGSSHSSGSHSSGSHSSGSHSSGSHYSGSHSSGSHSSRSHSSGSHSSGSHSSGGHSGSRLHR